MNPDTYRKLPADLKKLVDDSVDRPRNRDRPGWDSIDVPGKKALMDGGMQPIKFSKEEDARLRKIAAEVSETDDQAARGEASRRARSTQ